MHTPPQLDLDAQQRGLHDANGNVTSGARRSAWGNKQLGMAHLIAIASAFRGTPMPMRSKKKQTATTKKKWVRNVKTDSTHPPEGLFTKSAAVIARTLASKKVSPKGPSSGMRMLTYFINRGGRGLSASRRAELERAKKLLSQRIQREKQRAA